MNLRSLTNIAHSLTWAASAVPDQLAVAEPTGRGSRHANRFRTVTFAELEQRSRQIALGVQRAGVQPGDKISLMVPPGIDFVAWVFGLLKARATLVLIDPGMGRRNMIRCLQEVQPDGLAGVLVAQVLRRALQRRWPNCHKNFTVGSRWLPCGQDTRSCFQSDSAPSATQPVAMTSEAVKSESVVDGDRRQDPEEAAAIIFTTGSTGPPKGVLYRHRHFIEQTIQIRDYFQIEPGGADVSGFPLFALFNTGMATTTIFPKMDATRPASIHPPDFLAAVEHFQANQSFGSPALWNTVARHCERNGVSMPSLKRVLTAGAPVPEHVLKRVRACIAPQGEVFTPYGATESLPVACIGSREVIDRTWKETRQGGGICVGQRWPQIQWKVIAIEDGPLSNLDEATELPPGGIGELIVQGPVVTDRYVTRVEANALHKIADGTTFWHRMGDVGYLDTEDRFWFCGRKGHRVQTAKQTLFTIPCEAIFNQHPAIYRSALVGVGQRGSQTPCLIAEPWPERWPQRPTERRRLQQELLDLAQTLPLTSAIRHVFVMRALPVDIRHNSKIFREQLAIWATRRLGAKASRPDGR